MELNDGNDQENAEENFPDIPEWHLEGEEGLISDNETVLDGHFVHFLSVTDGQVDIPSDKEETKCNTKEGDGMIGIGPAVRSGEILDLPEAKGHESHEREPEALIDGIESYSVDEYFFEESTYSIEPVDGFVFEQRCNKSERSVNDNEGEVVASTDKESRLPDGLLELGGSGFSLVGFRNERCEEIGQELEVEFAQF